MSSFQHLKRMDRMGLRPAGHSVSCTCDDCWRAADAAFRAMIDRKKAKKKAYDERRHHERRTSSQARYRVSFFFGRRTVGEERFRAPNDRAAIEIANYLYRNLSDVARSYRLFGSQGQLLLIYERPPVVDFNHLTDQMRREARYTAERLAGSKHPVSRSKLLSRMRVVASFLVPGLFLVCV